MIFSRKILREIDIKNIKGRKILSCMLVKKSEKSSGRLKELVSEETVLWKH